MYLACFVHIRSEQFFIATANVVDNCNTYNSAVVAVLQKPDRDSLTIEKVEIVLDGRYRTEENR